MTNTFSDSALTNHSVGFAELKSGLVEPALVFGAALFWIVALPFVALSLMFVKIWDTLMALATSAAVRPDQRRGLAKSDLAARSSDRAARF